jgi:prepilin-type N-terminal cleavage/methylation domain-containing protein
MIGVGPAQEERERGFTLVELLVALALSLIVLLIAGGTLVGGLRTQKTVESVTTAATSAQQIVRSVQSGVRNAVAVTLIPTTPTGAQFPIAQVTGSDPASTAPSCQAWYYTPDNGGTVYTKKSAPTSPAVAIALPTGGPQGVWTLLGVGVSPYPASGQVFTTTDGSRVLLKFDVTDDIHPYVLITTTIYTTNASTVSPICAF